KKDDLSISEINDDDELKQEYYDRADLEMRNNGYKIYSTIDPTIHKAIEEKIYDTKESFGNKRVVNYEDEDGETQTIEYEPQVAGALAENDTGKILAFVGGRD